MTAEMFLGGLMILTAVACLVLAMTSTRPSGRNSVGGNLKTHRDQDAQRPAKRSARLPET